MSERVRGDCTVAGFTVVSCTDAEGLGRQAAEVRHGAALLAVGDLDGVALKLVRQAREAAGGLPLIVYAERFREVTRLRYLEMGADDFVPAEAVAETVGEFLRLMPDRPLMPAVPELPEGERQMYFQLQYGELSNALQFLCMTSRTGELVLSFGSDDTGQIFLADNTIVHARYGEYQGSEAVARMLGKPQVEAQFFQDRDAPQVSCQGSISQFLIESSVLADELEVQDGLIIAEG